MLRKIFGFMQRLENSTNTIICTLLVYQSWAVRFIIWNSWIDSLYEPASIISYAC